MVTIILTIAALVVIGAGLIFVTLGQRERAPDCDYCSGETWLYREENEYLGNGFLQLKESYQCYTCRKQTERETLNGPTDLYDAA